MSTTKIHGGPEDSWHGRIDKDGQFPPETDRYHLYIGLFCPFAHRVNLVRHLKGLRDVIDISIVKPYPKGDDKGWPGWIFPEDNEEYPGATVDELFGSKYLHEVYFKADKDYKGKYSVPVLWDKKMNTIVCNESAELLRTLPLSFNAMLPKHLATWDLYPENLRHRIDLIGNWMARDLNSGVYKAGFAHNQETYEQNVIPIFAALNKIEKIISTGGGPYLLGTDLTELDIQLYVTIVRFDTVYVQHFKCNLGTIRNDYPVINNWMKNLYWNVPGFKETTNFKHIKENYTKSHPNINPTAITPKGPVPTVQEGFERDFSRIKIGEVKVLTVLERERTLEG